MRTLKRKFPHSDTESHDSFHDFPFPDADACVKCGLCLPHCPTYALHQHEGDSPRGRIALMQGLAEGRLPPQGNTVGHLDGCLVCRACETVCPAEVPYGRLIDAGRSGLWRSGHRPGVLWRLLAFFRRTPKRIHVMEYGLALVHRAGLIGLLRRLRLGRRLAGFVPRAGVAPRSGVYTAAGKRRGAVMLFLGCIARALDASVLHASIRVLNQMGYDVHVPGGQGCCGAMEAHAGDTANAARLGEANIRMFEGEEEVLAAATGCGVVLREYGARGHQPDIAGAEHFGHRVHDVMDFIRRHADELPPLAPLNASVLVHAPCTLRNGLREGNPTDVLRKMPGATVEELRWKDCCGAAGTYLFEHPGEADALGNRLLASIKAAPDYLVTSNTGCSIHLARLFQEQGIDVKVRHPVELLAESLGV